MEDQMTPRAHGEILRNGMAAVALAILLGQAAAQDAPRLDPGKGAVAPAAQLQLTPEQRAAIVGAVRPVEGKVKTSGNVPAVVGADVPPATELYFLPDDALASAP